VTVENTRILLEVILDYLDDGLWSCGNSDEVVDYFQHIQSGSLSLMYLMWDIKCSWSAITTPKYFYDFMRSIGCSPIVTRRITYSLFYLALYGRFPCFRLNEGYLGWSRKAIGDLERRSLNDVELVYG